MEELPEKADRLDAIRDYLYEGTEISPTQMEMLERYKAVFTWMCKNKTPSKAIDLAQETYGISYSQAAKIVRDAIKIYGDVNNYSKQGLKQVMYERFMNLGDKAAKKKEFVAAERLWDKACKIMDLYNSKAEEEDITKLYVFNAVFTTNPEVLKKNADKTIDIEHEEQ